LLLSVLAACMTSFMLKTAFDMPAWIVTYGKTKHIRDDMLRNVRYMS
jgi:hypothetical protein